MVNAVIGWDVRDGERIDTFQAANVVPVLRGIGAALVMRVDAAVEAEVVLCRVGIELVELQMLRTLEDADAAQWD